MMDKAELKIFIGEILVEQESGAARKAKAAGLAYAKFGRWKDPKTGKVVAKSYGDELIKFTPEKEEPVDKQPQPQAQAQAQAQEREREREQDVGRQYGQPPQPPAKPNIPAGLTTQQALAQRKMQQKIRQQVLSPILRPAVTGKTDPTWYNNTVLDLADIYGFKEDDISPRVIDDLYKKRLSPEDAAAEYSKIKSDVSKYKKKECQQIHGENIMTKGDLRKIIREIIAEELSLINEKWEDDVEVKKTGEHKDKSIEQLKREIDAIEKKEPFNRGEWSERMFALRAKQGWKKGKDSTGTTEVKR